MRATPTTICIVLGICAFVAGCKESSANQFNWGKQDQVAAESEYDYDYDEEGYYGCEKEYYADGESYDDEYYSEYDQSEYGQVDYVAYEPCEHGYWFPHQECQYID